MNRKVKLSLLVLLLIFILVLTGCFGNTNVNEGRAQNHSVELIEGFERFENDYFEIQFDNRWTQDATELMEMQVIAFLSPDGLATVNVIREEMPIRYNLEQYKNVSLQNARQMHGRNMGETTEERTTVNGLDAYKITYDLTQRGLTNEIIQVLIVCERTAFVISFAGNDEDTFNKMLDTFVIK